MQYTSIVFVLGLVGLLAGGASMVIAESKILESKKEEEKFCTPDSKCLDESPILNERVE